MFTERDYDRHDSYELEYYLSRGQIDDDDDQDDNQDDDDDDQIDDEFTQRIRYHMKLNRPQRQIDALETVLNIHDGDFKKTAERLDYFINYYQPKAGKMTEWNGNWHYGWLLAKEIISHL